MIPMTLVPFSCGYDERWIMPTNKPTETEFSLLFFNNSSTVLIPRVTDYQFESQGLDMYMCTRCHVGLLHNSV